MRLSTSQRVYVESVLSCSREKYIVEVRMGPKNASSVELDKFKVEINDELDKLRKIIENQAAKIELLESTVQLKSATVDALQDQVGIIKSKIAELSNETENLEQYGRRSSLRIYGVPVAKQGEANGGDGSNGAKEDVIGIVKDVAKQIGVVFNRNDIFRAHRVGKKSTVDGKEVQQVIVKWRSWDARNAFYRARPTYQKPLQLQQGEIKKFGSIGLDLTKTRIAILKEARGLIEQKGNKKIFAFADINASLFFALVTRTLNTLLTLRVLRNC